MRKIYLLIVWSSQTVTRSLRPPNCRRNLKRLKTNFSDRKRTTSKWRRKGMRRWRSWCRGWRRSASNIIRKSGNLTNVVPLVNPSTLSCYWHMRKSGQSGINNWRTWYTSARISRVRMIDWKSKLTLSSKRSRNWSLKHVTLARVPTSQVKAGTWRVKSEQVW